MKVILAIFLVIITSIVIYFGKTKDEYSMNSINPSEREAAALNAIKDSYGSENSEYNTNLFVTHHIDELESSYWEKLLGTKKPSPQQVLEILTLQGSSDDNQVFDFTLPDDVTNYIISVRFNDAGEIDDISMES
jgi:hypothetical protein